MGEGVKGERKIKLLQLINQSRTSHISVMIVSLLNHRSLDRRPSDHPEVPMRDAKSVIVCLFEAQE